MSPSYVCVCVCVLRVASTGVVYQVYSAQVDPATGMVMNLADLKVVIQVSQSCLGLCCNHLPQKGWYFLQKG